MDGNPRTALSYQRCQELCQSTTGCVAFVYAYEANTDREDFSPGMCWLKNSERTATHVPGLISGPKYC